MRASVCSIGAFTSSQAISVRGIIIEPICRSSRRKTLRTIWCSCASITPASTPSSRLAAISSSVTLRTARPCRPSSLRMPSVLAPSSLTKGRVAADSQFIGAATRRATVSGNICPMRLGTSSPKMIVRKVMLTTTMAVAAICATSSSTSIKPSSHSASGRENAASPTMPLRMPIDVMPICTVDRNLVGFSCRSIAACAPGSPASTMTCSRALRLAVSAISDMAKAPFKRIRKASRATSMRAARPGGGETKRP